MANVFCTNCGEKLSEGARFCSGCGTPVAAPVSTLEQPPQVDEKAVEAEETQVVRQESVAEEAVPSQQESAAEEPVPAQQVNLEERPAPVQPQAEVKKGKKEKKNKSRRRGVFRTIMAVLVCMLVFAVACSAMLVMGMRGFVTEDNLQNTIHDVVQDLDNIPAAGISDELGDDATLMDAIIGFADENGVDLSKKDIEKFVEDSELVDAVCEKLAAYVTDIQEDGSEASLDKEDFEKLLKKDRELVYEVMGEDLSDREIEQIAQAVEEAGILEVTNAKELKQELSPVYYGVRYGLSLWSVVALWVVVGLLVLLLAAINRWSMARTTGDVGITLTAAGALILLAVSFGPVLVGELLSGLPFGEMIGSLASSLTGSWVLSCLIVLGIGVALILVSCIIKAISGLIQRRREAKVGAA